MSLSRRTVTKASIALLCAVSLSGCVNFGGAAKFKREVQLVVESAGTPAQLDVSSRNGKIDVFAGSHATFTGNTTDTIVIDAVIKARTQERADATQISAKTNAEGVLEVRTVWPDGRALNSEGTSYVINMAQCDGAKIHSSNGSLRAFGTSGMILLDSSNGSIRVEDHAGDVNADTSNGSVKLIRVSGRANADTSNGSIEIVLTPDNPGPLHADSSNGSVSITVGPAFVGTLKCNTSNGRVNPNISSSTDTTWNSLSKTSGALIIGNPEPVSIVKTSNSSITINVEND